MLLQTLNWLSLFRHFKLTFLFGIEIHLLTSLILGKKTGLTLQFLYYFCIFSIEKLKNKVCPASETCFVIVATFSTFSSIVSFNKWKLILQQTPTLKTIIQHSQTTSCQPTDSVDQFAQNDFLWLITVVIMGLVRGNTHFVSKVWQELSYSLICDLCIF